jgi:hypothetical protein
MIRRDERERLLGVPMLMLSQMAAVTGQSTQETAMGTGFQDLTVTTDAVPGRAGDMTVNPTMLHPLPVIRGRWPAAASDRADPPLPSKGGAVPRRAQTTAPPPHRK